MTFDPKHYDLEIYIKVYEMTSDWVSLRDSRYPPESCNPSSAGRYHKPGEATYYAASGLQTARAEVLGDPDATIPSHIEIYSPPTGEYRLFDVHKFIDAHREASGLLTGPSHDYGQILRSALLELQCSGVIYPSAKVPGGHNAAVWPLDQSPLPEGSFFKHRPKD